MAKCKKKSKTPAGDFDIKKYLPPPCGIEEMARRLGVTVGTIELNLQRFEAQEAVSNAEKTPKTK